MGRPDADWLDRVKYSPPAPGNGIIRRGPLQSLVIRGIHESAVTLIHAPAGFGKTTLLAQIAADLTASGHTVAWLTCGQEDSHPDTFTSNLANSLVSAGVGESGPDLSVGPIIRALEQAGTPEKPALLILDEAEAIDTPGLAPLLERLGTVIGNSARLLVGARHRPAFASARLRLASRLTVIGPVEMRFLEEDAINLLGDTLTSEVRETLLSRAQGWPMVLQLARQLLSPETTGEEVIALLSAPDSDVFTYIAEQIFDRLPPQARELLKAIAIFDKVDPQIAGMVTQRDDSYELLQDLRYLQPIMVFDHNPDRAASIHPLFREFLLERLRRDGDNIERELRLRAANFLAERGSTMPAVQQAVAAGSPELACRIIEEAGGLLLNVSEGSGRVRTMLQGIPDRLLAQRPRLLLTHILEMMLNDRGEVAIPSLADLLRQVDPQDPLIGDDLTWVEATLSILEHPGADDPGQPRQIEAQLARASRFAATEPRALAMAQPFAIISAQRLAPMSVARTFQEETLAWYAEAGLHRQRPWGLVHQAMIDTAAGDYDAAMDILTLLLPDSLQGLTEVQAMLTQTVNALVADIAYQRGDLELCRQRLARLPPPKQGTMYEILYAGSILAARCAASSAAREEALKLLENAGQSAAALGLPNIRLHAKASQALILLGVGRLDEAKKVARGLPDTSRAMTEEDAFRPWLTRLEYTLCLLSLELELGRTERALELARRLLDTALRHERRTSVATAHLALARVLHARGDAANSLAHAREALALASGNGSMQIFMDQGPVVPLLLRAVSSASDGSASPLLEKTLARWEQTFDQHRATNDLLTDRELDILAELALGHATKVAARSLAISPETVKHHLKSIFRKLEVHDRHEAVLEARRRALIP